MALQGKQVDERPPEQQVEEMAAGMRRLMHSRPADVTQFLLDCCVELGHKVPTYAMLLGECSWWSHPKMMRCYKNQTHTDSAVIRVLTWHPAIGELHCFSAGSRCMGSSSDKINDKMVRMCRLYRAGLLNADDSNFGAAFVRAAAEGFEAALAAADRSRARLLLRLLAALAVPGVLHPSAVLAALEGVVRAALEIAEEGETVPPSDSLTNCLSKGAWFTTDLPIVVAC